ncbi:uncharacterized protein EV420DRAFT_1654352 [Desarmillaria tabescens]|uniref:Uncharacterized protein n=1 Tax=Armillaria tabescens TaxID=1929756 RepID=A0AA39J1M6_ARMTA|nr:uncharacterized protein EV420DRAFT_1654352 [Desarmillaria tabescens]KAK0433830.1 hypothetical protein EV420DRAFT_1654352 [Desarmillaria tabescens]
MENADRTDKDRSITTTEPSGCQSSTEPSDTNSQHPGKTWQMFFERQGCETEQLMNGESIQDKQRRKAHELHAKKQLCPKAESKVFYWCTVEGTAHLCRKLIPYRAVLDFWDNYTPSQRRYSAFWNEWDLNFEFDLSSNRDDLLSTSQITVEQEEGSIKEWELMHERFYGTSVEELCPEITSGLLLGRYSSGFASGINTMATSPQYTSPVIIPTRRYIHIHGKAQDYAIVSGYIRRPSLAVFTGSGREYKKDSPLSNAPTMLGHELRVPLTTSHQGSNPDFTVHIIQWYRSNKVGYEIRPVSSKRSPYRLIVYRATDVLHCLHILERFLPGRFCWKRCVTMVHNSACAWMMKRLVHVAYMSKMPSYIDL